MGRNLNALLGGGRERRVGSGRASADSLDTDTGVVDSEPALTTEEAVQPRVATTNADEGVVEHAVSGAAGKAGLPAVDLTVASERGDTLRMLGVDQIRRGAYQPRRQFDQELLQELAASLKAQGMIQPILVRPFAGAYEIIAGERRWRAAQLAGIGEVPAIVRELDDQSVAAVSLIENIQRKDLNPLEEAQALQRLCEEFAMTHQAVADSVGRSRAAVTNLMRLLELHDEVKVLIDRGEVDMGHARALLGAPAADQLAIAQRIVKQGLTVRAVEKLVRELKNGKATTTAKSAIDPDIEVLTRRLGDMLGAPVRIRHKQSGAGKLEIAYTSVDELEGILAHIK
jgi:ParB family chromosome partitioning protein